MKTNFLIAVRLLKSRSKFSFFTFSTYLSIFGLILGVSSIIIISSVTRGFNASIEKKLSNIDGHIRITNIFQNEISTKTVSELRTKIADLDIQSKFSPYIESHGMIRIKSKTDGVLIYGVENNQVTNVFHFDQFIIKGESKLKNINSIILGEELAKSLETVIGDEIILINLNNVISHNSIKADKFVISGIFSTGFPEYDKLPVFITNKKAQNLFDYSGYTGLISTLHENENLDQISNLLSTTLPSNVQITTWKDRHYQLISWLKIYDVPIKLLMLFITVIAIFNIAATLWMNISSKTREIGILKSIGFTDKDILNIFQMKSLIIGVIGSAGGCFFGACILFLQKQFHIIEIPSTIYFMSYLPVKVDAFDFLIVSIITISTVMLFALIPSKRASNINPSVAVTYE